MDQWLKSCHLTLSFSSMFFLWCLQEGDFCIALPLPGTSFKVHYGSSHQHPWIFLVNRTGYEKIQCSVYPHMANLSHVNVITLGCPSVILDQHLRKTLDFWTSSEVGGNQLQWIGNFGLVLDKPPVIASKSSKGFNVTDVDRSRPCGQCSNFSMVSFLLHSLRPCIWLKQWVHKLIKPIEHMHKVLLMFFKCVDDEVIEKSLFRFMMAIHFDHVFHIKKWWVHPWPLVASC